MSRLTILLDNQPPTLQGEVRQHKMSQETDNMPDFRTMIIELRETFGVKVLCQELGMSDSTINHVKRQKKYWDLSYRQGIRTIRLYETVTMKRYPVL